LIQQIVTSGFLNDLNRNALLRLTNINKRYGSHEVLDFPMWEIGNGVYWLKGKNGTGKSTLFRIISGQTPFTGDVELNGISLKKQPIVFRSKISFAEAEPQYPSFITGNELLEFYRQIRHSELKEIESLAAYFEMSDFLDMKIGGYSSGMVKKLSLICAFLGTPDFYILDEPLITIDAISSDKLLNLIKAKVLEGKSFLLSSHQQINNDQLLLDGIFQIVDKQLIVLEC
jgi:ABC-2 type transport system ATP-binding protein